MRARSIAIAILTLAMTSCNNAPKTSAETAAARSAEAKAEAEAAAARAAQAKAEAELAASRKASNSTPVQHELVAPKPTAPTDGVLLDTFPRKTTLRWSAVPGAAKYKVEVEYQDTKTGKWLPLVPGKETSSTDYEFEFVGAQPGHWRVWALDANGKAGPKSDWATFRFTK